MKKILARMSNWRLILPSFVLFLIFATVLFPQYQNRMTESAGQQVPPLDSRFSYTYNEVMNDFDKLGTAGRNTYRFVVAKVDMAFPVIYGALFILVLAWLLKKVAGQNSGWMLLALLPCIGILFDYSENFNTLALLDNYPAITEERVALGEQLTRLKHIFLLLSVGLILFLAITLLIKNLVRRKTPGV